MSHETLVEFGLTVLQLHYFNCWDFGYPNGSTPYVICFSILEMDNELKKKILNQIYVSQA